ncbi:hypothetical protein F4820DRAFT_432019 [Hypoxylon rubiginosum]|uniref:Uncharacterized protein n=1 Tax=Hypoxylon rubiginosum TaxID=110542 RepID=A0ACB9YRB5_9PEZI|nr:hypothetical protein F4820DRAFT_432019 [Hypoxylon rubiginosum]
MESRQEFKSDWVSRPMGKLEEFFKMLCDGGAPWNREHWHISLVLSLNPPPSIADLEPYLRRAWYILRQKYPALGAIIKANDKDPKETPHIVLEPVEVGVDIWTYKSFVTHGRTQDADELLRKLHPDALATCHWIPSTRQVMIRSSHWRIDGVGMLMLGHRFMETLVNMLGQKPDTPLDSYPTNQPREHILGSTIQDKAKSLNNTPKPVLSSLLDAGADAILATLLQGMPSIALPTRPGSEELPPSASDRRSVRLDADTTARLVATCRSRGFSVTSAVHAAIVCATARFPQHPLAKAYASFAAADLRRVLHAYDQQIEIGPLGLFHLGLPICIKDVVSPEGAGLAKDFETVARELHAVYSQDMINFWDPADGSGRKVALFELAESVPRKTMELYSQPLPPELPPVQTPDLSSLGRLERFLQRDYEFATDMGVGKVEIKDCWLGTEMLTRAMQFHVWSWKEELTLAVCFNASFYEESFASRILELVREELVLRLGI